jgi:hypothetical protein
MDVEVQNEKNPDGNGQRDEQNPGKGSFHAEQTPVMDLCNR